MTETCFLSTHTRTTTHILLYSIMPAIRHLTRISQRQLNIDIDVPNAFHAHRNTLNSHNPILGLFREFCAQKDRITDLQKTIKQARDEVQMERRRQAEMFRKMKKFGMDAYLEREVVVVDEDVDQDLEVADPNEGVHPQQQ